MQRSPLFSRPVVPGTPASRGAHHPTLGPLGLAMRDAVRRVTSQTKKQPGRRQSQTLKDVIAGDRPLVTGAAERVFAELCADDRLTPEQLRGLGHGIDAYLGVATAAPLLSIEAAAAAEQAAQGPLDVTQWCDARSWWEVSRIEEAIERALAQRDAVEALVRALFARRADIDAHGRRTA